MSTIILLDAGCCSWLCFWWLFWTLGAFLLGALLYHLLFCRGKSEEIERLKKEVEGLRAKLTNAEKDRASLQYQLDEANKQIALLKADLSKCEGDKAALYAKLDAGDRGLGIANTGGGVDYMVLLGHDNLQIVEGIGPKIEGILKAGGIDTLSKLAETPVENIQKLLDDAGPGYRLADPKTWPRQAELAVEGKWEELIEYQKFLDAGRDTTGDFDTPSKVEQLLVKLLGYSLNPEDLKVVEGIGPKIEKLLKNAGIKNWNELASASQSRLKEILDAGGDKFNLADPGTWPKQAELAANGKWGELKNYQDVLTGGKNPDA